MILVTGGTGFVGANLVREVVGRGEPVRVLARASSPRWVLDGLGVEWAEGDLRDRSSLARALKGVRLLYHVAADYRLWASNPGDLYAVNVDGTRALLEEAGTYGVERIVYTSSVAALGVPAPGTRGTEETPVDERRLVGDYKRSKYLAEQVVLAFARAGLPVVIVNPTTPIGPWDVKPTPTGRIVLDFLTQRMPAYVDTGLNIVHVQDVARGHLLAAEKGVPGERYILGHRNMTLCEILQTLARLTGSPAPTRRIPHSVAYAFAVLDQFVADHLTHKEPRASKAAVKMARSYMYYDASKAVRDLGLPQTPVEEAFDTAIAWFTRYGYVTRGLRRAG